MKQFLYIFVALFLTISPVKAQVGTPLEEMPAGIYQIDPTHASITWKVSHLGLSDYTARFTKFSSVIDLKPNDLAQSSLSVTIDPTSLRTDYPKPEEKDFDKKLAEGEGWFNAGTFPLINFTATQIEITGDNTGKITGDLEMLGARQPLKLDVTFNKAFLEHPFAKKPALGFSATTTLKRSEWGFDTYIPSIGDEVEVLIEAEFIKEVDDSIPVNE